MNLSVCTIMKNEENNIQQFLESLKKFGFQDIVLVDTGSVDRTVDIAKKYVDNVYYFEWEKDFSKARNYAATLAKNDNILALDVDEIITDIDFNDVEKTIENLREKIGQLYLNNYTTNDGIRTNHYVWLSRIYNRKYSCFKGSIHEQVKPIIGNEISLINLNIKADHTGYDLSLDRLKKKAERNNEILFKEIEKNPNNPYLYFQVGQSFLLIRDHESAIKWFEKAISFDLNPNEEYAKMIITGYGECLMALNKNEEALSLLSVYDDMSDCPEYVFMMGQIYMNNNQIMNAYKEFLRCLSLDNERVQGMTSYFPLHNIAVINEMFGEKQAAIDFYKKAAAYGYARSAKRLEELLK